MCRLAEKDPACSGKEKATTNQETSLSRRQPTRKRPEERGKEGSGGKKGRPLKALVRDQKGGTMTTKTFGGSAGKGGFLGGWGGGVWGGGGGGGGGFFVCWGEEVGGGGVGVGVFCVWAFLWGLFLGFGGGGLWRGGGGLVIDRTTFPRSSGGDSAEAKDAAVYQ